MLHKINVRIDAGKLKEQPLLPEILQVLKVVRPAWLPENICSKVSALSAKSGTLPIFSIFLSTCVT